MKEIFYRDNNLEINNSYVSFEFPIKAACSIDEYVIVLLDPDSNLCKWGQFPNIFGVSLEGKILWKSELPTTDTGDSYLSMRIEDNKLKSYAWSSYICIIDYKTGKILSKVFTK